MNKLVIKNKALNLKYHLINIKTQISILFFKSIITPMKQKNTPINQMDYYLYRYKI